MFALPLSIAVQFYNEFLSVAAQNLIENNGRLAANCVSNRWFPPFDHAVYVMQTAPNWIR